MIKFLIQNAYKFVLLFCLTFIFSCSKNNDLPRIDEITKTGIWNIKINATTFEVYQQLQELNKEKSINRVSLVYRKPYTHPEQIKNIVKFYDILTLQNNDGVIERTIFFFNDEKVSAIEYGGSHLGSILSWPQNSTADNAISVNDPIEKFNQKILHIFKDSKYANHSLILPDKPLALPFDTDMKAYEEWAFDFSENINAQVIARHLVRLYFKNNKLVKIKREYSEFNL